MSYIKQKSIFMIYLIVTLIFAINLTFVSAQDEQQVCCESTIDGDSCVEAPISECAQGVAKTPATCENTAYCKLGTCINALDGICSANVGKAACKTQGGTWVNQPLTSISQCQPGCCRLATECSFVTQQRCVIEASNFPGLEPVFEPAIESEEACVNSCRSVEKGACVKEQTNKTISSLKDCELTTRDSCDGEFYKDLLCSNPKLATSCAPMQYTDCLKEDVYWFDSCGNPENVYNKDKTLSYNNGILMPERLINEKYGLAKPNDQNNGNCEYPEKTICGNVNDGEGVNEGNVICKDIDCSSITEIDNLDYTKQTPKQVGESWCLYDSRTGFGYDTVGSRHYRAVCVNGEELIEPCKDYREEMCIQNKDLSGKLISKEKFINANENPKISEAACRPNRFDDCKKCNQQIDKEECCNDVSKRDCYMEGDLCVPLVTPGLKFWDASASEDVCKQADQFCKVYYHKSGTQKSWDVLGPKECTSPLWVVSGNSQCKAEGDCGAWYNYEGKLTTDGFDSFTTDKDHQYQLQESDVDSWANIIGMGKKDKIHKFSEFMEKAVAPLTTVTFGLAGIMSIMYGTAFWATAGSLITSGLSTTTTILTAGITQAAGKTSIGAVYSTISAPTTLKVMSVAEQKAIGTALKSLTTANIEAGKTITQEVVNKFTEMGVNIAKDQLGKPITQELINQALSNTGQKAAETSLANAPINLWAVAGSVIMVLAILYSIYQIYDIVAAKSKTENFMTQCKPWQPPDGGKDCEKCNDYKLGCSEYRCKSLGKSCQIINKGTEEEKCTYVSQYDTKSPVITEINGQKPTALGFTIKEPVKAFAPVKLFFKTDEPSQCKYDLNPGKQFDDMFADFGSSALIYEHELTLKLPALAASEQAIKLTNGGKYRIYLRCKDANGNENEKDYYYGFKVDKGPDMTPPIVEQIEPPTNSPVAYGQENITIMSLISEPAQCKWSTMNKGYDEMENDFICTGTVGTESIYFGLYRCLTELKVNPNKDINNYFIKCKDFAETPNTMAKSKKYSLKPTPDLEITNIEPTGELTTNTPLIQIQTKYGAEDGIATCGYSQTDSKDLDDYLIFPDTNSTLHQLRLGPLDIGEYNFYVSCVDIAGNTDYGQITFTVTVDTSAPTITRIYTDDTLHIVTSEPAQCQYSSIKFDFGEGTEMLGELDHEAALGEQVYYIVCQDEQNNELSATIYP